MTHESFFLLVAAVAALLAAAVFALDWRHRRNAERRHQRPYQPRDYVTHNNEVH